MNKPAATTTCPFHAAKASSCPHSPEGIDTSWHDFRRLILPRFDPKARPPRKERLRIPDDFVSYMGELAPYLISAIAAPSLSVQKGIFNPRIRPQVDINGDESYKMSEIPTLFGARNVDEVAVILCEIFGAALSFRFHQVDKAGLGGELKSGIVASRESVGAKGFPVESGIGTAVDLSVLSFAALLKLCKKHNVLNEVDKDKLIADHAKTLHRLSVWGIRNIVTFSSAVANTDIGPSLPAFLDGIFTPSFQEFATTNFSSYPWDLKHFSSSVDPINGIKLRLQHQFTNKELRLMISRQKAVRGCPFKKNVALLAIPMLEKIWDAIAVPLMEDKIKV
jgi:hypothetical protein